MKAVMQKLIKGIIPFAKIPTIVDENACRTELEDYSKRENSTCIRKNNVDIQCDLQIIIPAYNVEKYIKECINSVLCQVTDYSYLITVINDGSTDKTGDILLEYDKNNKIILFDQENRGFSGARNRGLEKILGKYVMFLDSDDRLPEGAIQNILNIAYQTGADIVQGSWYEFSENHRKKKVINANGKIISTDGIFSGYPWGKVFKSSVLETFQLPEKMWFEDTPFSFILEAMPLNFAATSSFVYEYRINPNGITQNAAFSKKALDSLWITEICLSEFECFGLSYDQRAYDYFLRQIVINYLRTRKAPMRIRKAIFCLTEIIMSTYFTNDFECTEKKYALIETAIKKKYYLQYELAMLLFR